MSCSCIIKMKERVLLIDLLVMLFSISSWISINGLWVEVPLLVGQLPEGWKLASYLAITVQIANIGPILYSILKGLWPQRVKIIPTVYLVLLIGSVASLCLALLWRKTAFIQGEEHSVALIILIFFLSIVDCTSSVLFFPFMATLPKKYLTSFLIGEALSGFIPSVVSLIQGVGGSPKSVNVTEGNHTRSQTEHPEARFSVEAFFYFLLFMMIVSGTAFTLLNYLPVVEKARTDQNESQSDPQQQRSQAASQDMSNKRGTNKINTYQSMPHNLCSDIQSMHFSLRSTDLDILPLPEDHGLKDVKRGSPTLVLTYLLFLQTWICTLQNGIFTSVQTYSALPYGVLVFHLSVSLSSLANPLVCSLAFFLPTTKVSLVSILTSIGTLISCYLMALAVLSPSPPLVGNNAGKVLVTMAWILFACLFTYSRLCITTICRTRGSRALFYCGAATQFGSALGALVMFFIVNFTHIFKSA